MSNMPLCCSSPSKARDVLVLPIALETLPPPIDVDDDKDDKDDSRMQIAKNYGAANVPPMNFVSVDIDERYRYVLIAHITFRRLARRGA